MFAVTIGSVTLLAQLNTLMSHASLDNAARGCLQEPDLSKCSVHAAAASQNQWRKHYMPVQPHTDENVLELAVASGSAGICCSTVVETCQLKRAACLEWHAM
jgi:hypothetical protein